MAALGLAWRGVHTERARRWAGVAQDRYKESWAESLVQRLQHLEAFDWTTIFGAEVLFSVLPLVILLGSLADTRIDDDISRHIGLDHRSSVIVEGMFRTSPAHPALAILVGMALAFAGTVGVVASLQVLYERSFHQSRRGWRDLHRYVMWVAALLAAFAVQAALAGHVRAATGGAVLWLLRFVFTTAFFWWTIHFLLHGRVLPRAIFRTALVTSVLWLLLAVLSGVFFSSAVSDDSRLYGTIGVVFTLLSWFILIGVVVVFGAAIGTTWEERRRPA
jgi:membrane protein